LDKLAAAGKISWEDARSDSRRHHLRSAVDGTEIDIVGRSNGPLTLNPRDIVILASDGIQTLSLGAILDVAHVRASDGPNAVADALLEALGAIGESHQDNTTVIAVYVTAA